jgi:hypothetical protein
MGKARKLASQEYGSKPCRSCGSEYCDHFAALAQGFEDGWQAHAAQPVSEAAVEAGNRRMESEIGISDEGLTRRILEAALTVMREEQK